MQATLVGSQSARMACAYVSHVWPMPTADAGAARRHGSEAASNGPSHVYATRSGGTHRSHSKELRITYLHSILSGLPLTNFAWTSTVCSRGRGVQRWWGGGRLCYSWHIADGSAGKAPGHGRWGAV